MDKSQQNLIDSLMRLVGEFKREKSWFFLLNKLDHHLVEYSEKIVDSHVKILNKIILKNFVNISEISFVKISSMMNENINFKMNEEKCVFEILMEKI